MACPVRVLVFKVHQWARRVNMKGKLERIGALIVGAGIGAGVALLFAPKTGKQTRRDLRRSATRSLDRLEDLQGDLRKYMTDWVEEASAAVASGIQCGKDSARQGGDRVIHVLENARKYMEEGKERVQRYVQSVAS
jgi:gas vesicle protein